MQISESIRCEQDVTCNTLQVATGGHGADKFNNSGQRLASSVEHEQILRYGQPSATDAVSATQHLGNTFASGTIHEIAIALDAAPVGGNKLFTVDVQKGSQASGFASVLASGTPITIDTTRADRQVVFVTPTVTAFNRGDEFRAVIAASGSTGTQGRGFSVNVKLRERPN